MGLLKFTKSYSSSDDGSNLTGAELEQLQADISAVLNGGISNINIATDAAIVESKVAFNTTSGHNHDGSNSKTLSGGGLRGFRQGAGLTYVTAATIKAQSGVLEIGNNVYTRNSYSTAIDLGVDTDWVGGTSLQATSSKFYVYAYNDSGSTYAIKYWDQPPEYANTISDDSSIKIFRSTGGVWYRCLGFFYNDASQNIQEKTVENIDGELTYGDWWTTDKDGNALANNTSYQALTDGYAWAKSNGTGDNNAYTDSTGTLLTSVDYSASSGTLGYNCVRTLVRRNDYWKVNCAGGTSSIRWLPLMRKTIT